MRVKVTSDSTCDLSPELLKEYDITMVPLTVVKGDENFLDGVTITPADIFAHVAAGGSLCSTAAVSIGEYQNLFQKYASQYDAVIHVNISAEFSTCYQNACLAARDFPNVRVIDSRNLSTGQGHVVLEACKLGKTVDDLEEICRQLQDLTERVEASFVMNRLEYMVKGGRCSSAAALGANLLNLRPCIEVKDGKMQVVKKYRGAYPKCLANYVKDRLAGREDIVPERLFITHTPVEEDALAAVKEAVGQYGRFREVCETSAGCTVSCHCGPGTLGILFIRK
ncbi:MAG: DegV family protein [Candidatus Faecousia sp.]|nr:DegV family protein [Bacillota bacterium]MDY4220853.1 DegV family protein [Candidatus Faecousia sp.]